MKKYLILLIACFIVSSGMGEYKGSGKKSSTHLPDLDVYDIHGKHTTLGALGKNKVTFIDNWFIPCPSCFREMGMLHQLYFKYKSNPNVNFITICRTDSGIVKKFLAGDKSPAAFVEWYQLYSKRTDFKLPIYFIPGCKENDKTKCADAKFGFSGYPTIVIYDRNGKLIFKRTGFELNEDESKYMAQLDGVIKGGIEAK